MGKRKRSKSEHTWEEINVNIHIGFDGLYHVHVSPHWLLTPAPIKESFATAAEAGRFGIDEILQRFVCPTLKGPNHE